VLVSSSVVAVALFVVLISDCLLDKYRRDEGARDRADRRVCVSAVAVILGVFVGRGDRHVRTRRRSGSSCCSLRGGGFLVALFDSSRREFWVSFLALLIRAGVLLLAVVAHANRSGDALRLAVVATRRSWRGRCRCSRWLAAVLVKAR
jgi:hypothetical protein